MLQYLKEDVSDEVHADKICMHAWYKLTVWLWWGWSSFPKIPEIESLQCLQDLKKEVRDEVDFLHADKHQRFLQVDKFPAQWCNHY